MIETLSRASSKQPVERNAGRKPASESRAAEIRARLMAWKQMPEAYRSSLRGLAAEMGTSHQLLSFYLRRLDTWQKIEGYRKQAQETPDNRPLTKALCSMLGPAIYRMLRALRKEIKKHGKLSGPQIRIAKLLAGKGYLEAQEMLNVHFRHKNNLPVGSSRVAKSFR